MFTTVFDGFLAVFNSSQASSLTALICTAMGHRVALITAWLAVSGISVAVWVLTVARIVISVVLVIVVVDCDVAVSTGGSGSGTRCWGVVCQLGSVCRRF